MNRAHQQVVRAAWLHGDLAAVRRTLDAALAAFPRDPEALVFRARAQSAAGEHGAAIAGLERAAGDDPAAPALSLGLAEALRAGGRSAEAEALARRLLDVDGQRAEAALMLARLHLDAARPDRALELAIEASTLARRSAAAWLARADAHLALGEVEAALAAYRKARDLEAGADAWAGLAAAQRLLGALGLATAALEAGLARFPRSARLAVDLAALLPADAAIRRRELLESAVQGDVQVAAPAVLKVLVRELLAIGRHGPAAAVAALGTRRFGTADFRALHAEALWYGGRAPEAVGEFAAAAAGVPLDAPALRRIAEILMDGVLYRPTADIARAALERASTADPGDVEARVLLSRLHARQALWPEALRWISSAVTLQPDSFALWTERLDIAARLADWSDWEATKERVRQVGESTPVAEPIRSLGPFLQLLDDPVAIRNMARARAAAIGLAAPAPAPRPARPVDARVRIGYVSSDFRDHPLTTVVRETFARHDRARFEVIAYSSGPVVDSPARRAVIASVDRFVDLATLGDATAAERIAADGVDVLVDLSGYTQYARPAVLARRPAPVQVNWLGQPATMGAPFIDYLVADATVLPPGDEAYYDECVVRLPHSFFPPDAGRVVAAPRSRAHWGLPETAFVIACFNATWKISPATFDEWMAVLRAAPRAVLWLADPGPIGTGNLRREAERRGIDAARLHFAPRVADHAEHLARYPVADVAADCFPYGSHTTGADALWAGCPLVTRAGRSFAARVAASLLRAAGLPDLVKDDAQGYVGLLVELAHEPARIERLRRELAEARSHAPLFDGAGFVKSLEHAYSRMVARCRAGERPVGFDVAASDA